MRNDTTCTWRPLSPCSPSHGCCCSALARSASLIRSSHASMTWSSGSGIVPCMTSNEQSEYVYNQRGTCVKSVGQPKWLFAACARALIRGIGRLGSAICHSARDWARRRWAVTRRSQHSSQVRVHGAALHRCVAVVQRLLSATTGHRLCCVGPHAGSGDTASRPGDE